MADKKVETAKEYILRVPAYIRQEPDLKAEKVKLSETSAFAKNNSYTELFAILKVGTKITPLQERKIEEDLWLKIQDGWLLFK